MSTMLIWTSSGGRRGRCDASCYNATGRSCGCICGGANHGAGHNQAVANTQRLAEAWAEAREREHPGEELDIVIRPGQLMLPAFDLLQEATT